MLQIHKTKRGVQLTSPGESPHGGWIFRKNIEQYVTSIDTSQRERFTEKPKKLWLYHHVPQNMQGTTLCPLNSLKMTFPAIYATQVKKVHWTRACPPAANPHTQQLPLE